MIIVGIVIAAVVVFGLFGMRLRRIARRADLPGRPSSRDLPQHLGSGSTRPRSWPIPNADVRR